MTIGSVMTKEWIAGLLIVLGLLSAAVGVYGLFKFNVFYMRLLVSANVDTVGMLLMLSGACVMAPSLAFLFKIILIIALSLITTPLSNHATARSAYTSGYRTKT